MNKVIVKKNDIVKYRINFDTPEQWGEWMALFISNHRNETGWEVEFENLDLEPKDRKLFTGYIENDEWFLFDEKGKRLEI